MSLCQIKLQVRNILSVKYLVLILITIYQHIKDLILGLKNKQVRYLMIYMISIKLKKEIIIF